MPLTVLYLILFFLAGIILGSFYNVCIYRIPRDQSVAFPASHCTSCGHALSSADLVPVFSWIFLRGICRYCKSKISVRYPLVESLTGMIFAGIYLVSGITMTTAFNLVFASLMIIITFIDIDFGIIPDRFIITGTILAVVKFFVVKDLNWTEVVIGGVIGGGVLLLVDLAGRIFYKKEGMGLGDVKLMLMAGAYLGYANTIVALLGAIWIGAIAGIIILRSNRTREDNYMAFGPFLALGSLIALFGGKQIIQFYLSLF